MHMLTSVLFYSLLRFSTNSINLFSYGPFSLPIHLRPCALLNIWSFTAISILFGTFQHSSYQLF